MRQLILVSILGLAGAAWCATPVIKPSSSAKPGGSSGQIQYNNGGVFGGLTGSTVTNGTTTLSGLSVSGVAAKTIPYADTLGNIVGTTSDLYFDTTNKSIGMGVTGTIPFDIDVVRRRPGTQVGFYAQNTANDGDTVIKMQNDLSDYGQFGIGGSAFSAPYSGNTFITSTKDLYLIPSATKNIVAYPAGIGYGVTEGSNAKMGTFTLSSGAAWVPTTAVTANSRIFLTVQTKSGTSTGVGVTSTTVNAGFNAFGAATDNSTVAYLIFEAY